MGIIASAEERRKRRELRKARLKQFWNCGYCERIINVNDRGGEGAKKCSCGKDRPAPHSYGRAS